MAAAAVCAVALAGCGTPFFISEQDLLAVLYGDDLLYTAESTGVGAYQVDGATGRLDRLSGSPFGSGCFTGLAAAPDASYLYGLKYFVNQVEGFKLGQDGTPQVPATFTLSAGGPRSLAIQPQGRFAYLVHLDQVSSYGIDPSTGALSSIAAPLGLVCGPSAGVFESGGRYLYVGDSSRIQPVQVNPVTGAAALLPPVAAPTFRSLAAHPGGYLYGMSTSTTDKNISAYRIDAAGGLTDITGGTPYRLGFGPTNLSGSYLAVDPVRDYLYANNNVKSTFQYSINDGSGALSINDESLGSVNVTRVAASTTGRYVFVAGQGAIIVYRVGADGTLSEVSGSPFPSSAGIVNDLIVVKKVDLDDR
jgi:6-phosphogluconolactonase (cycloisomerase 2 family)